jgi:TetR/AcrR family transcriptional repressor of nem operon
LAAFDDASGLTWVAHALDRYLSTAHRDHPRGCAYPAVLSEVAAGSRALRLAFADALELRVRAFEAQLPESGAASARERALATMALTIGGLLLAKASAGSPLSNALLAACRTWALPEATPAD